MKTLSGMGVLGVAIFSGDVVTNDAFPASLQTARAADPFRGRRSPDGTIRIAGMEFSHPKWSRTIRALERAFEDPFRGTRRRRYFPPGMLSSDAEAEAGRRAIEGAGLTRDRIDALLVQSFLPDEIQPQNAALVAHKLGLSNLPSWGVDSICNSPIAQLQVACALVASGQAEHVLCVHSAAYSRVQDPGSSCTFQDADMAAAFVVGPSPGSRIDCAWRTDGRLHAAIRLHWAVPQNEGVRRYWQPSRERLMVGWDEALQAQVMGELEGYTVTVCGEALARANMKIDDIDVFISHHPNAWFGAFMADALGLRDGIVFDTFEEYAVINSATLTSSIYEALRARRIERGSRVLLFGPGAGYTYGAAAMVW
ncbi:3-oxoacyl-ACP synthase III family protein [Pendulispora albinea]|uniref:3-oxoacyl-ACP synthase n=1 Tax=Pendulispora albinea TaxID=2741071 RepID=A0ABZ2LPH6_9BACT